MWRREWMCCDVLSMQRWRSVQLWLAEARQLKCGAPRKCRRFWHYLSSPVTWANAVGLYRPENISAIVDMTSASQFPSGFRACCNATYNGVRLRTALISGTEPLDSRAAVELQSCPRILSCCHPTTCSKLKPASILTRTVGSGGCFRYCHAALQACSFSDPSLVCQ